MTSPVCQVRRNQDDFLVDRPARGLLHPALPHAAQQVAVVQLVHEPVLGVDGDLPTRDHQLVQPRLLQDAGLVGIGAQDLLGGGPELLRRQPRLGIVAGILELALQARAHLVKGIPQRRGRCLFHREHRSHG